MRVLALRGKHIPTSDNCEIPGALCRHAKLSHDRVSAKHDRRDVRGTSESPSVPASQTIDWYSDGKARTVEIDGVEVIVRFVGRKGRRARIAILAPAGAVFRQEQSQR